MEYSIEDVDRILEASEKATPGKWRWGVNLNSKHIALCGGKPAYDLTVMDFTRWGMAAARPRVLDYSDMMLLSNAEEYRTVVPGREHHASWFQGIDHPDMNLMAGAPILAEEVKRLRAERDADMVNIIENYWYILQNWANKGTPFPQEIEKGEKWIRDMAAKYHAF